MSRGWGGGGGGGGKWEHRICSFSCSPKVAVPCSYIISWNTVSEFYTFYSPLGIADRFFSY